MYPLAFIDANICISVRSSIFGTFASSIAQIMAHSNRAFNFLDCKPVLQKVFQVAKQVIRKIDAFDVLFGLHDLKWFIRISYLTFQLSFKLMI